MSKDEGRLVGDVQIAVELKGKGVTYARIVEKMAAVGVRKTEANIRSKLSRGKFTAVFMVQ